jgi:hypothetical protein
VDAGEDPDVSLMPRIDLSDSECDKKLLADGDEATPVPFAFAFTLADGVDGVRLLLAFGFLRLR